MFVLFFILSGFFNGSPFLLWAAEGESGTPDVLKEPGRTWIWGTKTEILRFGFGYYGFTGDSSWRISFPENYGRGGSTLEFREQKGGMPFFSLEISHLQGRFSLHLQGGKGRLSGGNGNDTDILRGMTYYQSRFKTSAETAYWSADLRTAFHLSGSSGWVLIPFLGWQHHQDEFRMVNGAWTCLYGQTTEVPFEGLDSRYTFRWDALRLGLMGEADLTATNPQGVVPLRMTGHLALFPFVRYRGSGIWNLREDFKKDPSFTHEADQGGLLGVDAGLSLVYRPLPWWEWEGGGRLFYCSVHSGKDRTYFSNGTTVEINLDEVQTFRVGVFLKMTGRF